MDAQAVSIPPIGGIAWQVMNNKRQITVLVCVLLWSWAGSSFAVPVTFYESFAGNINFQMTGATRRTAADGVDACAVMPAGTTGSAILAGVPAGSTILAAYLHWAGSGSTPDTTVTFQGSTINASRQFAETFTLIPPGTDFDYFSGFADVTSLVTGNGSYSFSGLTVNTGAPHCGSSAVLAGWALIVVYEHASQPLRVLNIFDGFQYFRGSRIDLSASNFQIPAAGCGAGSDCKFGVVSWEGDAGNSAPLNGFSENLFINPPPPPAALSDAVNPVNNQYNSTISLPDVVGAPNSTTSYGVDIDVFALTTPAHLMAGDTSMITRYESGGDLVWLSAQVFSVRNTPVSDLAVTKSHSGDFVVGQQGVYTIGVSNNGPLSEPGPITVTDTLPAGLSFVSGTGTGWSCGAVGQDVTCTLTGALASGASAADITLTVNIAAAAVPSVTNTASVTGTNFDNVAANDSASDPTAVLVPDLSTSIKTVVDLNGGDADPGDTLRYTITVNETGGAAVTGVSVTDAIDALLNNFSVVSVPAGATNNSVAGSGPLDISNINVTANGSVDIVFDAMIAGTANPGDLINNTAVINNPASGVNTNAGAPTVTVSPSLIPNSGTKNLYPYFDGAAAPDTNTLQRVVPAVNSDQSYVAGNNGNFALVMTPSTQSALELGAGNIPVLLCMDRNNAAGGAGRNIDVALDYFATGAGGTNGVIGNQTLNGILTGNGFQVVTFNINLPADATLNVNTAIRMTLTNQSPAANRQVRLRSTASCGINSRIELNANTVINIDSVDVYDAAYPGGVIQPSYVPGSTVFIRSVISDPFGSFDINNANIEIINALGATVQASTPMAQVNDSGVATRTYEYQYTIPGTVADGNWTARVTANEGTEGAVSDLGIGTFLVGSPSISMLKLVSTISDPVNAGSNPKSIPGAIVEFQISASNSGYGPADADSVVIGDSISGDLQLLLGNPANPIQFIDGSPTSGLGFTFIDLANATDDIDFSNDGGSTFVTPVSDIDGFDITVPPVNFIRITPNGQFNGSTGSGDPNFTIRFRSRVR
jgi:uncharacterized repeat protein (TIGR01451 family)